MKYTLSIFYTVAIFLASISPTFAASVPIVIVASGDTAGGASPIMVVYADAVKINQTTVTANHSQNKTQTISLSLASLPKKIEIAFTNDYYNSKTGADRNLYVISLTVNGVKYSPTQAVLDLGSTTWADSANQASGKSALYGNSKLDFTIAQPSTISGTCGSSNGANLSGAPTANLCAAGTASAVSGTGPWSWSCTGTNGGANASCSANLITNGACGVTNGTVVSTKPTTGLCTAGTASTVGGTNPWSWSCTGSNGGTNASCATVSPKPVNGACGMSNGTVLNSAPTTGLCTTGSASTVSGTGPWNWSCAGSNGGTNANCSAQLLVVNGSCGTANGSSLTGKPAANLCNSGTATAISGTGPWTWSCTGVNGGTNASCSANLLVNGACGVSSGVVATSKPTTNLCTAGTASTVGGSNPWTWSCAGQNGGATASCATLAATAVNGACGASNGTTLASKPTTGLCTNGTASAVAGTGPWSWNCTGSNGGSTAQCMAALQPPSINGVCGASNGTTLSSAPTTGLCTTGTASTVAGTGPWSWSCAGSNGGSAAQCSATEPSSGGSCSNSAAHSEQLPAANMVLTFDDEFNTLSASSSGQGTLWETKFSYNSLTQGNSDNYLYLDPAVCGLGLTPYSLNNGILDVHGQLTDPRLTACGVTYPYTAGHLDTSQSFSQQYGYFETRAKVSDVFGTGFAFWMVAEDGSWPPEIDAPETLGRQPDTDFLTNHSGSSDANAGFTADAGVDLADDYHTYGMMWDPNNITWYLDGKQVAQTPTGADEHKPFYVILDPMGMGDCGDGWGDCPQDSPSFNSKTFGADAFVDYVRVWQFSNQNPAPCIGD